MENTSMSMERNALQRTLFIVKPDAVANPTDDQIKAVMGLRAVEVAASNYLKLTLGSSSNPTYKNEDYIVSGTKVILVSRISHGEHAIPTGGSIWRHAVVSMVSARTVSVAGWKSVASSSSERRNPPRTDRKRRGLCRRLTLLIAKVASRGEVNWPKAPATSRSFALADLAASGGPATVRNMRTVNKCRPILSNADAGGTFGGEVGSL